MNGTSASKNRSLRLLVGLAAFVVIIAGLKQAVDIVVPFLMALFVAVICEPPLLALRQRGAPMWLALLLVIGMVLAVSTGFGILIGSSVDSFVAQAPRYEEQINQRFGDLLIWIGEFFNLPVNYNLMEEVFSPGATLALVRNLVNSVSGLLTNAFLILVTMAFLLVEFDQLPSKLRRILKHPEQSLNELRTIGDSVNRYLATKTLISAATGVFIGCWLWFFGIDFPVLWGIMAFALNFIPNIGSILAAIPATLLALVQLGVGGGLIAATGYLLVNMVIGNIIEPRIMGQRLGLSTLVVFLSLVFWGWVLGPVGMFLSVPLTMTIKITLENSDSGRWLAILLGNSPTPDPEEYRLRPDIDALPHTEEPKDHA